MRHDRLVGRLVPHRDAEHERALEPAAMLIRRFEIEIGRAAQFGMAIHHRNMARARVNPHVERVGAALRPGGETEGLGPPGIVFFKPEIRPARLGQVGHLARESRVDHGLVSLGIVENGKRNTPGALARDAPVRARLDRSENAVAAPVREPADRVDLLQRGLAKRVDADEKLRYRAENDGRL